MHLFSLILCIKWCSWNGVSVLPRLQELTMGMHAVGVVAINVQMAAAAWRGTLFPGGRVVDWGWADERGDPPVD